MRIEPDVLDRLRKSKDKDVQKLIEFYEFVTTDRSYESVVASIVTLNKWNSDLIETPVSILTSSASSQISIGEEGVVDEKQEAKKDKEVDRILKLLEKLPMLLKGIAEMQSAWTNDEVESLNKDKRIKDSEDRAFKSRK